MKPDTSFDSSDFRMYRFSALMDRLMSPAWSVIKVRNGFIFIPTTYRNLGGRHP